MTGLLVCVAALATSTNVPSYSKAYQQHKAEGRPLVVLVGADWCPGCRTMKGSSIPAAMRRGALDDVAFTIVDVDQTGPLADRLMRGNTIPQLIMYYDTPEGPRRRQLTGAQDVETIQAFIASGVRASRDAEVQETQNQIENASAGTTNAPTGS